MVNPTSKGVHWFCSFCKTKGFMSWEEFVAADGYYGEFFCPVCSIKYGVYTQTLIDRLKENLEAEYGTEQNN